MLPKYFFQREVTRNFGLPPAVQLGIEKYGSSAPSVEETFNTTCLLTTVSLVNYYVIASLKEGWDGSIPTSKTAGIITKYFPEAVESASNFPYLPEDLYHPLVQRIIMQMGNSAVLNMFYRYCDQWGVDPKIILNRAVGVYGIATARLLMAHGYGDVAARFYTERAKDLIKYNDCESLVFFPKLTGHRTFWEGVHRFFLRTSDKMQSNFQANNSPRATFIHNAGMVPVLVFQSNDNMPQPLERTMKPYGTGYLVRDQDGKGVFYGDWI